MAIAKVALNNETMIDLTHDIVNEENLHEDFVALGADGLLVVGEEEYPSLENAIIQKTLTSYSNEDLTSVISREFYCQTLLETVYLPNITSIGERAFYQCFALTQINTSKVTSLGAYAFYQCTSLISVNFPLVTSISDYAFNGCTSLTNFVFPKVTGIGTYALTNAGITKITDENFPTLGATTRCIIKLIVPQVTEIELSGPNLTLSNGSGAFRDCTSLISAKFPNAGKSVGASYKALGNSCFYGDTALELADLGYMEGIGTAAFYNCTSLRTLILRLTSKVVTLSSWGGSVLEGIYKNPTLSTIYVPEALIESYQTATNWSTGYAAGLTFEKIEGSIYEI